MLPTTIAIIGLLIVAAIIIFFSISLYIAIFGGGPFVPTPMPAVHHVLKYAQIKKGDTLYDIGAGDGRFVHGAEMLGARATGIEQDPFVYFLAKIRQWLFGWKGTMIRGNSLTHDLSKADIIICYMMPGPLKIFQKKFESNLRPKTRVISYAFHIGNWKPKTIIPATKKFRQIFIYEASPTQTPHNTTPSTTRGSAPPSQRQRARGHQGEQAQA